jgi:hypothetical protein
MCCTARRGDGRYSGLPAKVLGGSSGAADPGRAGQRFRRGLSWPPGRASPGAVPPAGWLPCPLGIGEIAADGPAGEATAAAFPAGCGFATVGSAPPGARRALPGPASAGPTSAAGCHLKWQQRSGQPGGRRSGMHPLSTNPWAGDVAAIDLTILSLCGCVAARGNAGPVRRRRTFTPGSPTVPGALALLTRIRRTLQKSG